MNAQYIAQKNTAGRSGNGSWCNGVPANGQTFGTAVTEPTVNLLRIEESLSAAHLRLAGVQIENLPWRECMARYDRPHTFFYCDPP
ncbi:hypothetical protein [Paraburkholderia fungorum]|uniref:hypothetical protein n=1 Tax=Paraburkholderia fungorum TaxID=134537 RepID=UPI001C0B9CC1